MKKNYQFPEITLVTLANEDVISTSSLNLSNGDVEEKMSFNNKNDFF